MKQATLDLEEHDLSELLTYLPNDHKLRSSLQRAGENIFNW